MDTRPKLKWKQADEMSVEELSTTCYLDDKGFYICCQLFLQHSMALKDGWSWVEVKGISEGFMKKTVLLPGRSCLHNQLCHMTREDKDALLEDQKKDDEYVVYDCQDGTRCEYHVTYSYSYQVPVLYFRASTLDGKLLSLEEVWNNIHPNYRKQLHERPWDTLTQQEHPFLGQPFFMIHPCRTEEFMRPVLQIAHAEKRRVNYIVTWLSVLGPLVSLDIPLSYCLEVAAPNYV